MERHGGGRSRLLTWAPSSCESPAIALRGTRKSRRVAQTRVGVIGVIPAASTPLRTVFRSDADAALAWHGVAHVIISVTELPNDDDSYPLWQATDRNS